MLWDELATNDQDLRKGDSMMYEAPKQQLLECKASIQEFEDFDPGFGTVWAASGFRMGQAPSIENGKNENCLPTNYDWALIRGSS